MENERGDDVCESERERRALVHVTCLLFALRFARLEFLAESACSKLGMGGGMKIEKGEM